MYTCVMEKEVSRGTLFTFLLHAVLVLIMLVSVLLQGCRRPFNL